MACLTCTADTVPGDRVVRLAVAGGLDTTTAEQLRAAVTAAVTWPNLTALELDLHDVNFCDAAGITALLAARRQATERCLGFRVTRARGIVHHVVTLTGTLATLTGTTGDASEPCDDDTGRRSRPQVRSWAVHLEAAFAQPM